MRIFYCAITALALIMPACQRGGAAIQTASPAAKKDTFRVGILEEIHGVTPESYPPAIFWSLIYDQPINFFNDKTGSVSETYIALEKMEINDKRTECLVTIRPGMLFHDGAEVTAVDVARTFTSTPSHKNIVYQPGISAQVTGKYTLRLSAKSWRDWSWPFYMSFEGQGQESGLAMDGGTIKIPAGSGPYKLLSFDKETGIIRLERWDRYWAGLAKYKYIQIQSYPSADALTLAFMEGKIDYPQTLSQDVVPLVRRMEGVELIEKVPSYYAAILVNHKSAKLADWRIRKALSLLIDRRRFGLDNNDSDHSLATDTALNHLKPYTKPEVVDGYDPQRALDLFAQAGWKMKDGRLARSGSQFTITILVHSSDVYNTLNTSRLIASDWSQAGINCQIQCPRRDELMAKMDVGAYEVIVTHKLDTYHFATIYYEILQRLSPPRREDLPMLAALEAMRAAIVGGADDNTTLLVKKKLQAELRKHSVMIPMTYAKETYAFHRNDAPREAVVMEPYALYYFARPGLPQRALHPTAAAPVGQLPSPRQ